MTGKELAAYAISKIGTPYFYGAKMEIMTLAKMVAIGKQYPSNVTQAYINKAIGKGMVGKVCADCSGLVGGYRRKQIGSSQLYSTASTKIPIENLSSMPIGAVLWKSGHVGVYIGDGMCVEAKCIDCGTIKSNVSSTAWKYGLLFSDLQYGEVSDMEIKGVDVSTYNGVIDWGKVKAAGYGFAILKIVNKGLAKDSQFEANWTGCTSAGVAIQGVYNYSYATTATKAKQDANAVIKALNGRKAMIWLDVEDGVQKGLGTLLIDIINSYKNVIESAGLQFGVYTGLSFYNSYIKPYKAQINCPFWIARYGTNNGLKVDSYKPSISHTLAGWQYTSKGAVNGISGAVDLNVFYQDAGAGSSNTAKITYPTVKYGDRGKYVLSWQNYLILLGYDCGKADGIFGVKTLTAVKSYQKAKGLVADGIIGAKTWASIK